ncbi:hypothetical protein [Nocardioides jensenii]
MAQLLAFESSSEVSADQTGIAGGRCGVGSGIAQGYDGVVQCGELGNLLLNLTQAGVEKVPDVLAGRTTAVTNVEDLTDLGEGETCRLAAVDEVDPVYGVGLIVPISRRCAVSRWEQALLLIEPQRLGPCARPLGEFPDAHNGLRSIGEAMLDLPLYWKVQYG